MLIGWKWGRGAIVAVFQSGLGFESKLLCSYNELRFLVLLTLLWHPKVDLIHAPTITSIIYKATFTFKI